MTLNLWLRVKSLGQNDLFCMFPHIYVLAHFTHGQGFLIRQEACYLKTFRVGQLEWFEQHRRKTAGIKPAERVAEMQE